MHLRVMQTAGVLVRSLRRELTSAPSHASQGPEPPAQLYVVTGASGSSSPAVAHAAQTASALAPMPVAAAPSDGAPYGIQLPGQHSQLFMFAHSALITAHLPTAMHVLML